MFQFHPFYFLDGRITTLASLDYETVGAGVTPCVLTVTANDGKMDSDPDTITLDITNIDEPPVFSSTGYTISTPEVAVCMGCLLFVFRQYTRTTF